MKRFTDKYIINIKKTGKKQDFTEGEGFILRMNISGNKTFYYRYTMEGKKKFIKLGTYPGCTLADARKKHIEYRDSFLNGINPQETSSDINTVGELANYWYEKYILINRKAPQYVKQMIDADIIPSVGNIKLEKITTRKLTIALDIIVDRGSNVHANMVLSALKQMFNFGISKGITDTNPLQFTKAMDVGGKERPRERNLSMIELKIVWLYLDSKKHRMHKYSVNALKLLILTGCRLSEVREAKWTEFNFDNKLWLIPKERYKTGIEHKVFITPLIARLLNELKELSSNSEFILPSSTDPDNAPLSSKALGRAIYRSQERIGIEKWTIHDFRRTFASRMADTLDIDVVVIEKLLGHKLPKIMATYQKDEMLPKRKAALEDWNNKIEMLVNNDNVVMLKTG